MQSTYVSVTRFYSDLKAHLLAAGLTVERTLDPNTDVILNTGSGLLRLQRKVVSPTVMAVGWEFGTDADMLAVSTFDPERVLPFTIEPGAEFTPAFSWYEPTKRMGFLMTGVPGSFRCYRVDCSIDQKTTSVLHEDRFNPQYEPNFKDTGGTYICAGA